MIIEIRLSGNSNTIVMKKFLFYEQNNDFMGAHGQTFDHYVPNCTKFYLNCTQFSPNRTQFSPNCTQFSPNCTQFPQIVPNFLQIVPNFPKLYPQGYQKGTLLYTKSSPIVHTLYPKCTQFYPNFAISLRRSIKSHFTNMIIKI